ncbi:MAG: histidine--tRNA ligase [Gammaproteobacteria bacterium]
MTKQIQSVRGMHDILPEQSSPWWRAERVAREALVSYGYREIRAPIVERTELFARSIGEVTDIVEKEMYTFEDRSGDSLTLRPEATAGCVRAGIEHGLFHNQQQRMWYSGPMFRHERPQKGRYRQFYQFGAEAFGIATPDIDAEMILMTHRIWRTLGLDNVELEINTLGTSEARAAYRGRLVEYLSDHEGRLDEESKRRLQSNPLRVLDSKNADMREVIAAAPSLLDHLDSDSQDHFEQLKSRLDDASIRYRINTRLVRGLDYYTRTVFEWITDDLGAQNAICGGGRYDDLVTQLGGRPTPAIGFSAGLERLLALMALKQGSDESGYADVYLVMVSGAAERCGQQLAEDLRHQHPRLRLVVNCGGGSFKSQLRRADKSGARLALILGEDEIAANTVTIKQLRTDESQLTIRQSELAAHLTAA